LRWKDFNRERGTIHIQQTVIADKANGGAARVQSRTKTRTGARTVRLTPDTLAALRDHRDRQQFAGLASPDSLIVCTGTGTPVNPSNVSRSFDRLVKLAGVPRIRVHDLRHTAATLLLSAGVPAKVVSERLGHATVAITMDLYTHVLPDMQGDAADAMSRIVNLKSTA
jgi:integrase